MTEGEEREKGTENLVKEIIDENFPNLEEPSIQETNRKPNYLNANKQANKQKTPKLHTSTSGHVICI